MRKRKMGSGDVEFRILALDDDEMMTLTLKAYFESSGYGVDVETDPNRAIERVRDGNYDILMLDFLMTPICGDKVVSEIRKFNSDIFIILLTGHKSMAPPIKTIRELAIQGYYEKSDRFDQLELLVESCVKSIRQMRTIRRFRDGLRGIIDGAPNIFKIQPVEDVAKNVLLEALRLLKADEGFVLLASEDGENVFYGTGEYTADETGCAELFDMAEESASAFSKYGTAVLPLIDERARVFGVLGVKAGIKDDELQLCDIYAKQAASALSAMILHSVVEQKQQEIERAYATMRDSYFEIVTAMRSMVDAKDINTRGHSDRVSHYSVLLAFALGKDDEYVERLRVAGIFHDIGKIGVADGILLKSSRLTDSEYEIIKQHPQKGADILAAISLLAPMAKMVECHHERYDGTGYPNGYKGEEIPEEARILAIADAFDAMTSDRRYRRGLPLEMALTELRNGKGTQFDPAMTDVFLDILKDYDSIEKELSWTYPEADELYM